MSKPIAIIGFGGHGRVCLAALRAEGRQIVAATDLKPESIEDAVGIQVISDAQLLANYSPAEVDLVLGLGSIWPSMQDSIRFRTVRKFTEAGYRFTGLSHPHAWIAPDAMIAPDAQIHAGCVVQPGARIGAHTILNTNCSVDHDCQLGEFCHIAPGVTISGGVQLGDGCHLGTGASVVQGISLGAGCFVAAGATVVRSEPEGSFLRGVPAKKYAPQKT